MSTEYGYARVSSIDQNEVRQLDALRAVGIADERIYVDHKSGKDFNRSAWRRLSRRLNAGDTLVISSVDRLGRNYTEIIEQWRMVTKTRRARIRVLNMPLLDTTHVPDLMGTFIADIVLQILSFVAETERHNINERQREGIAAAKARGIRFGRPRITLPECFPECADAVEKHLLSQRKAALKCGCALSTFQRYLVLAKSN